MEGQETTVAIVVIAAVVILLLAWLFAQKRRTDALRSQFGEEYERTLEAKGKRTAAEADLIEREKRVHEYQIRPLTLEERDRYAGEWTETKALFVDNPIEAVERGDRLLTGIMQARGFPMADFEQRHADLTVGYADVAKDYLVGHEIAARSSEATTEELRRAFNHYESLFGEMTKEVADRHRSDLDGDGKVDVVDDRDTPTRPPAFSTTTTRPTE